MLTTSELIDTARNKTGLSDFGDESIFEPMEWLVESLNHESELSAVGKQVIPGMLINQLVNLLEVESWYTRHPEIDDEQIIEPIFGIGLPRTGSTALGHMLALDTNTRVLRGWEVARLCPPPETATEHTDPRIAIAQSSEDQLFKLVPELAQMLPRGVKGTAEDALLLMIPFSCGPSFEMFMRVPSYAKKINSPAFDMLPAYRFHKRAIKLLQWRCPPRRWYLRTPMHTFEIESLNKVYPDAKFVMTHRDPVKSIPSVCSLKYHVRRSLVTNSDPKEFGESQVKYWKTALENVLRFRDRVGEERFLDIPHKKLITEPVEQARVLYEKAGWDFESSYEGKIKGWRASNPKGTHTVDPAFFGLDLDVISKNYQFYTERFSSLL